MLRVLRDSEAYSVGQRDFLDGRPMLTLEEFRVTYDVRSSYSYYERGYTNTQNHVETYGNLVHIRLEDFDPRTNYGAW